MGKVFGVYFNFGGCEDNDLGRILAGLDPNDISFGDSPPCFEKDMDDKIIEKGTTCMFGNLLWSNPNSVSIFLLYLANIAYHIDFAKGAIEKNPGLNNPYHSR